MENKDIVAFEMIIEERFTSFGDSYKMVVALVDGKRVDVMFLTEKLKSSLSNVGIKIP